MGYIGTPQKEHVVIPLQEPVPLRPQPEKEPNREQPPVRKREKVDDE